MFIKNTKQVNPDILEAGGQCKNKWEQDSEPNWHFINNNPPNKGFKVGMSIKYTYKVEGNINGRIGSRI